MQFISDPFKIAPETPKLKIKIRAWSCSARNKSREPICKILYSGCPLWGVEHKNYIGLK